MELSNEEINFDMEYSDNAVSAYFKEISAYPLLTASEEKTLAIKYKKGDNKAKTDFINSNLRLVVHVAKRYMGKGVPILDLIQEGNIGLIKAVDKFDPYKGYRFSTYAVGWMAQSITKYIVDTREFIRLPVHANEKYIKYNKFKKLLENKLNRKPTIEEIAKELNLPIEEVIEISNYKIDVCSIEKLVGSKETTELINFIKDPNYDTEKDAIRSILHYEIENLLNNVNLSEREIDILKLIYGIGVNEPWTLSKIGQKYHITKQAVDFIRTHSLEKLKRKKIVEEYACYTDNTNIYGK